MLGLLLATGIGLETFFGFQNPNNVSEFYTSGTGDKLQHQTYYANTAFAVLSIPFNFRSNLYDKPLPAGYYQLMPEFINDIPTKINFRQTGNIIGAVTVVDYRLLSYEKTKSYAEFKLINYGKMAQITLKTGKYEIYGIVEVIDRDPEEK